MFLRGEPDVDKVSFSVTDERGITTGVEVSTSLILSYVNGFMPTGYVPVRIDSHGFFVMDGKKLERNHSRESRTGQLLKALVDGNNKLVSYETIKHDTSVTSKAAITKTFKDLKYQLKQEGFKLDYALVKSQGIALIGIQKI